jgi:hypothetical protein
MIYKRKVENLIVAIPIGKVVYILVNELQNLAIIRESEEKTLTKLVDQVVKKLKKEVKL